MKKICVFFFLFTATGFACFAQTISLTGNVKNDQGTPLHYAFIQDKQLNTATFADSLGNFTLTVSPASQIIITSDGYTTATLDVAGHNPIDVILKADPTGAGKAQTREIGVLQEAFKTNRNESTGPSFGLMGAQVFTNTKQTVGSRFLFNQWVHGYVVKTNGDIVQNSSLLLNYDKMGGDLYLTEDLKSVIVTDKSKTKSFVLFSPHDQPVSFELMTGISQDAYCQVISAGKKYKIYKLTKTKFIPSNYKTDGIMATGNTYDEYADDNSYYVQNVTTTAFQPLPLKKKAFKDIFADSADKLNAFMAAHNGKIDDNYLKSLGDAVNQ